MKREYDANIALAATAAAVEALPPALRANFSTNVPSVKHCAPNSVHGI